MSVVVGYSIYMLMKPLRMIQAKLGLNWPSSFRGEDF